MKKILAFEIYQLHLMSCGSCWQFCCQRDKKRRYSRY